jgi:hypothetical protein
MTMFKHAYPGDSFSGLVATLDQLAAAGIDPEFDTGLEELERQFAEHRLTFNHS